MPKYIDIESVGIGRAKREQFLVPEYADGWNHAIEIFENEPAADVEKVKHGHWIEIDWTYKIAWGERHKMAICHKCSECGRHEREKEPYCHCGAKMDAQ